MKTKASPKQGGKTKPKLVSESAPIDSLKSFPGNPRRGDLAAIKESLKVNGLFKPVVVNRPTMEILAGNHVVAAARELDWTEVDVVYVVADPERARRIALADNRTADLAGYDNEALTELLADLDGFEGTGFDQEDLDALLDELDQGDDPGEDAPPPLPAKPKTKPGDLFQLGRHRLLCGDARDPRVYERLLGDERIDLLFSDPPYGIDYQGKTSDALRIQGDESADLPELLNAAFAATDGILKPGARIYICHPSGERSLPFITAFLAQRWRLHQQLVWLKDSMVLGRSDYHYRHELLLYGYKPGRGRSGRGGSGWFGDDSQTTVLEVDRPKASLEHPTMKPPELIEIALRNSTSRSHLVLDPFAGSGSTLIACEQVGRSARLVEIDPRYCDVVVARFEGFTGQEATQKAG